MALVRPFWALGQGKGPETTVWAQSVMAEAAAENKASVAVLWDARKFYESFDLDVLASRARKWGVPEPLLKL
eukprot:5294827-Prorocentrum_lima.AAC.1